MAGLTCAKALSQRGLSVTIFDKGQRPGGRMSTRRTDAGLFDHGCRFIQAHGEAFRSRLEEWHAANVLQIWHGSLFELSGGDLMPLPLNGTNYVGSNGIQAICDHLAIGESVRSGVEIKEVNRTDAGWLLNDVDRNNVGCFDAVVVAVPPSQAAVLLQEAPALAEIARSVPMSPCWTVMAAFSNPDRLSG